MVLRFNISKSKIAFKIALSKPIDKCAKDLSRSLYYLKKNWRVIQEVCAES